MKHWTEPDLPGDLSCGPVSRETLGRLVDLSALLLKWTARINLVAKSTVSDIWHRHIIDSLQIVPNDPIQRWCDIGSGGGLPGLVVACALPETEVILIESDQRKCAFLTVAKQQLRLENLAIRAERIETSAPAGANVVSARALASLDRLLPLVSRHIALDGRAILMKGASVEQEIAEAQAHWDFQLERRHSITDPSSSILTIRTIQACNR